MASHPGYGTSPALLRERASLLSSSGQATFKRGLDVALAAGVPPSTAGTAGYKLVSALEAAGYISARPDRSWKLTAKGLAATSAPGPAKGASKTTSKTHAKPASPAASQAGRAAKPKAAKPKAAKPGSQPAAPRMVEHSRAAPIDATTPMAKTHPKSKKAEASPGAPAPRKPQEARDGFPQRTPEQILAFWR